MVHIISPGSKQGKTTVAAHLISKLSGQGLRVCALKHTHHGLDLRDKDSYRLHESGAFLTIALSDHEVLIKTRELPDARWDLLKHLFRGCQVVVVEGLREGLPQPLLDMASAIMTLLVEGGRVVDRRWSPVPRDNESLEMARRVEEALEA